MDRAFRPLSQATLSADDWRLLVESVEDHAVFMLDVSGTVLSWTRNAQHILGYRREEIVGQHVSVLHGEQDRASGKPAWELKEASTAGRAHDEGWLLRKDGSRFWASMVTTALRDEGGALRGYGRVVRDLSQQRTAEDQLRRSAEPLHLLIEAVEDYAIYMLDPSGKVSTWNSGAAKIKGYTDEEIIGHHYRIFFTEEDARAGKPERELEIARSEGRFEEEGTRVRKDGSTFVANVVLTPIRDSHGSLIGFAKVTRDLSARVAAERTARELIREQAARAAAQASEQRIRESEERYRDLSQRLEVILEGVADGITVQDRSGRVIYANSAAARASGFASTQEFLQMATREIMAQFEVRDEYGALVPSDALPGRRVLRGEPPCAALLHVRRLDTGQQSWSLVRAASVLDRNGEPELAVNIWHDVTQTRRREQHDSYMARASGALSASLDYTEMLTTLAQISVPGLADLCAIYVLEDGELNHVAVAHSDPDQARSAQTYGRKFLPPGDKPYGVRNVIRTGTPELYPTVPAALIEQSAHSPEHLAILRAANLQSAIVVPIRHGGRILGAISLISTRASRHYDTADLALAEELGWRAGTAIENARLYDAERRARDQVELLARAGESFAAALGYEESLRRVVEVALPTLGDFALLDVCEGERVRRIVATAHEEPELEQQLRTSRWPGSEPSNKGWWALASGVSGLRAGIDDAARKAIATGPEELLLLRELELCSLLTIPLRHGGELLGALTVCFGKSQRQHSSSDLHLAEELARRAAGTIMQARLFMQAQEAAAKAEQSAKRATEANRVKDEFLATVSHELRTPLNAILGWASLLRERSPDRSMVDKGLEVIERNALAQSRIIDDILDVSRIITGKLRLDLRAADLVQIVRDAIEVVRPSATAKEVTLRFTPPAEPCRLVADPERLQQVIWNLLSNAVKFTPREGRVEVGIERSGSTLTLYVADSGRGIAQEFLPYVFERFTQAEPATTRRVGGLGLGLAIVRHLVELHGGEVSAESAGPEQGAKFTISLPVRAVLPTMDESTPTSAAASRSESPRAPAGVLSGLRVAVIDDEPDALELLEMVLTRAGAEVAVASSAKEGIEVLRRFRPQVLVSDIGMPEEDGYSFIQRANALTAARGMRIPSVALTAYARKEDKLRAIEQGFTTHMAKPVNADNLTATVANLAAIAFS